MIDRILAFFGYTRQYEEVSVIDNKKELILREYEVTITTVSGDLIVVPFVETSSKRRIYSDDYKTVWEFDYNSIHAYTENLLYSRGLSFHFPDNSGIRSMDPIKKIEYKATEKFRMFNTYTETITKKLKD